MPSVMKDKGNKTSTRSFNPYEKRTQGSFNPSTDAKSGKGGSVNTKFTGPNASKNANTTDAGKKGKGLPPGGEYFDGILRMGEKREIYVTSKAPKK